MEVDQLHASPTHMYHRHGQQILVCHPSLLSEALTFCISSFAYVCALERYPYLKYYIMCLTLVYVFRIRRKMRDPIRLFRNIIGTTMHRSILSRQVGLSILYRSCSISLSAICL